jgi:predicted nucleic acid-binding protein
VLLREQVILQEKLKGLPDKELYSKPQEENMSLVVILILPEISDYEVRRGLLHKDMKKAINRLDELKEMLNYLPITTDIMLKAAELWATARKQGIPSSDPKELDCDIILSSQCLSVNGIIVTENIKHFNFVKAISYKDVFI